VTVAGTLFNVPPAAIRAAVQRHPGAHERIDLVFLWPSLAPPTADAQAAAKASIANGSDAAPVPRTDDRVFVTIAGLGAVLAPLVRLRTIYPRYIEAQAAAGPDGLAILPFRAGTPYEGEDLVYLAEKPEEFFALCSRPSQDRHLEIVRPLVVFIVDEQHTDELIADIDFGGIVLLRPRHHADARIGEQLLEISVELFDFLHVHRGPPERDPIARGGGRDQISS
jgi:hypothetical protein